MNTCSNCGEPAAEEWSLTDPADGAILDGIHELAIVEASIQILKKHGINHHPFADVMAKLSKDAPFYSCGECGEMGIEAMGHYDYQVMIKDIRDYGDY